MTNEERLYAPPTNVVAASIGPKPGCAIIVRTADGRQYNLGRPDSIFFPLRRRFYLWRRRHEMKEV